MLFSELLRMAALGLVIGGLGALALPGHRAVAWSSALVVGICGSLGGGYLGNLLLGSGFLSTRYVLAAVVSVLLVCALTLYLRERRLPR
jgi:uncharacterized membrane protein YeaQ/YmgE (transglycosylase-associated protein family)